MHECTATLLGLGCIFKNGENVASSAGNQHPDDPYSAAAFTESEYSFVIGANPTDLSDTAGLALDDVKVYGVWQSPF